MCFFRFVEEICPSCLQVLSSTIPDSGSSYQRDPCHVANLIHSGILHEDALCKRKSANTRGIQPIRGNAEECPKCATGQGRIRTDSEDGDQPRIYYREIPPEGVILSDDDSVRYNSSDWEYQSDDERDKPADMEIQRNCDQGGPSTAAASATQVLMDNLLNRPDRFDGGGVCSSAAPAKRLILTGGDPTGKDSLTPEELPLTSKASQANIPSNRGIKRQKTAEDVAIYEDNDLAHEGNSKIDMYHERKKRGGAAHEPQKDVLMHRRVLALNHNRTRRSSPFNSRPEQSRAPAKGRGGANLRLQDLLALSNVQSSIKRPSVPRKHHQQDPRSRAKSSEPEDWNLGFASEDGNVIMANKYPPAKKGRLEPKVSRSKFEAELEQDRAFMEALSRRLGVNGMSEAGLGGSCGKENQLSFKDRNDQSRGDRLDKDRPHGDRPTMDEMNCPTQ